jgi:endonuclease/exonuclease/phosphatase family metal-dependent hydrolase
MTIHPNVVCRRGRLVLVAVLCCVLSSWPRTAAATIPPPVSGEFRVATWNIRSGDGRCPIGAVCPFTDSTQNCKDVTQPRNAWGHDVPQAQLRAINQDQTVIAMGLQEAWNCGSPAAVREALSWPYASESYNGTALLARFGISGVIQAKLLSQPGDEQMFILGADVCVNAACSATIHLYVAHLGYSAPLDSQADGPVLAQAQAMLAWIATQPHARHHVLTGDFNAFEREVEASFPCELTFDYQAPHAIRAAGYVDAWTALHGTQPGMTATLNRNGCGSPNGNAWKRIDYGYLKEFTPASSGLFAVVPPNTPAPSDHYGLITGFTGAVNPVATTPPPLVALPAGEILLRAADVTTPKLFGRWSIVSDASADGGKTWTNPNLDEPKIVPALRAPANYFDMAFTAAAGTPYHLWLRMNAHGDSYYNDSVWVQFSDSMNASGMPAYRIGASDAMAIILEDGVGAGVAGWGWADNAYGTFATTVTFEQSGSHVIRVQQREDGVSVDQILLSPAAYLATAPGPPKHDSTLFRPTQAPQ